MATNRSITPGKKFTLAFQHGFHGFPLLIHLGLNLVLLRFCGIFSEKVLGAGRFLTLTVAAMLGYAVAHTIPWIDGHGSSGVIWAYGPIVFMTLSVYRKTMPAQARRDPIFQQGKNILIIMWAVVTAAMTVIPYLASWRGNILLGLILGNIFHISGTIIGCVFAFLWRKDIRQKLLDLEALPASAHLNCTKMNKIAIGISLFMPIFLIIIMLQVIIGRIPYQP